MKILLPSYRTIGWLVKAYARMHEKYWGDPVVLLAEEDYSEGQFEFACPPWKEDATWVDGDVPGEFPTHHFTDVLIWYLRQIEDEHVIIMLSDYLLTAPVDKALIVQLQEYMELHKEVLRGHLERGGGFHSGQLTDTYRDLEIWEGHFLPTSLTPAIWNRELVLEMMRPRGTPWSFELHGRDMFPWNGCRSIAPQPEMLSYLNCIRGRNMNSMVMTHAVYEEVKQFLKINVQQFIG